MRLQRKHLQCVTGAGAYGGHSQHHTTAKQPTRKEAQSGSGHRAHIALVVHDARGQPVVRGRGRGARRWPAVGRRLARAAIVRHLAAHLTGLPHRGFLVPGLGFSGEVSW